MQDTPDLYATLQVHHLAEPEVIEAAYHRLARMYHPDTNKSVDAAVKMTLLNLAYDVLGDPDKRAEYDRQRGYQQGMAQPGPSRNAEGRHSADANATKADATTRKVETSMEVAKRSGRYEIVEIPLRNPLTRQSGNQQERAQPEPKRGAEIRLPKDVNATDADGRTELHTRAALGHIDMVQALIAAGADVNAKDYEGETPLHLAAFRGRQGVVNALISAGADVDARIDATKGDYQATPLHYAAMRGHVEVVNALVSARANFDLTSMYDTPLHKAAENGHVEVVNALISAGADVNAKERDFIGDVRATPLYKAVGNGHVEVVNALISAGADVHAINYARTIIYKAAANGHDQVVKALISAGADVHGKFTDTGYTPLSIASANGHGEVVKALISAGADVRTKNNHGSTPLHDAAWRGHGEVVRELISAGADLEAKDGSGHKPRYMAKLSGHNEIAEMLKRNRHRGSSSRGGRSEVHEPLVE